MAEMNASSIDAVVLVRTSNGLPKLSQQLDCVKSYLGEKKIFRFAVIDLASTDESFMELCRHDARYIVTWRLDCLTRDLKDFFELCRWLVELGQHEQTFISTEEKMVVGGDFHNTLGTLVKNWMLSKKQIKKENARLSSYKSKLRGTKVGRHKVRDDDLIQRLRDEGHSIREIACKSGVSTTTVQNALGVKASPRSAEHIK
jgi:DNA invertase Pin-like site-specific DNA recombinase